MFIIMNTWTRGRIVVSRQIAREHRSVRDLQLRLESPDPPARAPGTAVFLASSPEGIAAGAVAQSALQQRACTSRSSCSRSSPRRFRGYPRDRRLEITEVLPGIVRGRGPFRLHGDARSSTSVLLRGSHARACPTSRRMPRSSSAMSRCSSADQRCRAWEKRLFAFLLRNSRRAASFYRRAGEPAGGIRHAAQRVRCAGGSPALVSFAISN